ncbi:hypothetical protein DL96DRAFT_680537 [Flagelloscypha sp. PMI_526]|nr:hypothetical protein DL96DRAFT_680537 [Flagelloscypha sp. PMI_526]
MACRNIMLRPEHQVEPLVPCEHFDLIGGSGHGGFIALMFGSLRLSVRTALDEYTIIHRFLSIEALDMDSRAEVRETQGIAS